MLAAAARATGIPARLGFADVRNHLTSDKLRRVLGSDLFVFHGYTELHLKGRWVKATPAFNRGLCEKIGIAPLEFDGESDSVYQPLDLSGRRHMEYVRQRGVRLDIPCEEIWACWIAKRTAQVSQRRAPPLRTTGGTSSATPTAERVRTATAASKG